MSTYSSRCPCNMNTTTELPHQTPLIRASAHIRSHRTHSAIGSHQPRTQTRTNGQAHAHPPQPTNTIDHTPHDVMVGPQTHSSAGTYRAARAPLDSFRPRASRDLPHYLCLAGGGVSPTAWTWNCDHTGSGTVPANLEPARPQASAAAPVVLSAPASRCQ